MRILFAIDSLGPGGAERSLVELLPWLHDAQIETSIVTFRHSTEGYVDDALATGTELCTLRARQPMGRVRELRRLLQVRRPDILHTTLIASDVIGRIAAYRTGVSVLTSIVNTSYDPVRRQDPAVRSWRLRVVQTIDGWTARHMTDRFHAITNAVADAAVESLGIRRERVTVVARGRDPVRIGDASQGRRRSSRTMLGLDEDDEVLVAVGRHEWQKGHLVLLEALSWLVARRPRARLVLAGREGSATGPIGDLVAKLGLSDRVLLLGYRADVADVLAAADVFVFPSLYEGLGGSVLEAMALGLPVVASDLPALREVVEDDASGILVPPGDPLPLARAMQRVLADDDLAKRLGARGREAFSTRFTLEVSARSMIDLYRSMTS